MSKITPNQNIMLNIHDYTVMDVIGAGSFGTCYKVRHKKTKKFYVWKAVDFGSMSLNEKKLLVTEVNLIGTLKYPHIVQYFGRIIHQPSGTLYIIMEWCERGDLNTLINVCRSKDLKISEKFVWKVLYQTAKALEACHSLLNQVTVLHRDIKPANIFLDKHYNVKLGDFGLAKILVNNANFSSTVVGTPYYMSPEQIQGSKYNKKTDVWSLGCLIHELCCLHQPFNGNDMSELKENITKNRLHRIPSNYSDYLDKIVKLLLNSNHEFRPSVEMIIHHPIVICNYDGNATPFQCSNDPSDGEGDFLFRKVQSFSSEYFEIDEGENNINDVIEKIQKLTANQLTNDSNPQVIIDDVHNRKLINRLKLLREKESDLKVKENSLKAKEYILKNKECALMQKWEQIEKREREIKEARKLRVKVEKLYHKDPSKCCRNRSSHLDNTTCNADTNDISIVPTAVRLDPTKTSKPSFLCNPPFNSDRDYECHSHTIPRKVPSTSSKSSNSIRKHQPPLYKK